MKIIFHTALSLGAAATLNAAASLTLLNDNFTDETLSGWTPPSGMSMSVTNDSAGIGSGNALLIKTTSSNRRGTALFDQPVTLSASNSITLKMDYRYLYGPTNLNQSLEFRFTDSVSVSSNYMGIVMNPATNAAQALIFGRKGDTNEGKKNSFNHGTNTQSIVLTVTRIVDTNNISWAQFDLSWTNNPAGPYTAGKTSAVVNPAAEFTFDTLSIGITGGAKTDGLLLDNILVTTTESGVITPVLGDVEIGILPGSTNVALTWLSENGVSYGVEATTNLVTGPWDQAMISIPGNGGSVSVTGTLVEAETFYRVYVEE